jgi:hypothetical protein
MNTPILFVLLAGFTISGKWLLISAAALFFIFCVILYLRFIKPALEHDKKLDDEKITAAVKTKVTELFDELEGKITALTKHFDHEVAPDTLQSIKEKTEIIATRLHKMTDESFCTLTVSEMEIYDSIDAQLRKLQGKIYSAEQVLKGLKGFTFDASKVDAEVKRPFWEKWLSKLSPWDTKYKEMT